MLCFYKTNELKVCKPYLRTSSVEYQKVMADVFSIFKAEIMQYTTCCQMHLKILNYLEPFIPWNVSCWPNQITKGSVDKHGSFYKPLSSVELSLKVTPSH